MPKAILSVFDKTGLVPFASALHKLGWQLISSGGTSKALAAAGIPCIEVAEYTGSPEILGGRVKTLHPAIHGGLLARANEVDHQQLLSLGWDNIDLAVVNLYPFEQTVATGMSHVDVIENIDIGGVTLIRAAAKNYERVLLVCDPSDYNEVISAIESGRNELEYRKGLALKGFTRTAAYDSEISNYLSKKRA
jgi:phosphoribosylaminoimidazolecarboxamide formyltransferase/IMP cyclohydrolase